MLTDGFSSSFILNLDPQVLQKYSSSRCGRKFILILKQNGILGKFISGNF